MTGTSAWPRPDAADMELPFDDSLLDELLEAAGIDVLLVTSKPNIQYLLGGYWFFFFANFDALGLSRYLPILVYPKRRPDRAVYVGNAMESSEAENGRFWCATVDTTSWGTLDAVGRAIHHVRSIAPAEVTIGVEFPFLPADAADALRAAFPPGRIVDAHLPLERLRTIKTPKELGLIREASQRVVEAMAATFAQMRSGMTKFDLNDRLRQEEVARGLRFDYCLMTSGTGRNRAPSNQVIQAGDIVSLDSGGSYGGYPGDLCRMGIVGEPDAELQDLLAWVELLQQTARRPIRPGVPGRAVHDAVEPLLRGSPEGERTHFVAHGMGLIGHEAPRLSDRGPVPYPDQDASRPLEEGMVLSIETTLLHPRRGFIKLEDTLAVTRDGWVAYGDGARGWNPAVPAAARDDLPKRTGSANTSKEHPQ